MKPICIVFLLCLRLSMNAQILDTLKPATGLVYSDELRYLSLLGSPAANSKGVASVKRGEFVDLLEYKGGRFIKVRIPPGQLETDGYLQIDFFKYDRRLVDFINNYNGAIQSSTRLKYAEPPQFIKDRLSLQRAANSAESTNPSSPTHEPSNNSSNSQATGSANAEAMLFVDATQAFVYTPSGSPIPIRKKPDIDSQQIGHCQSVDSVLLLEYTGGKYYRIALASNKATVGYVYVDFLIYDEKAVRKINDYNNTHSGKVKLTYTKPPTGYKSQKTNKVYESVYSPSPSSSKTIQTGPRGGRYYINKNGKKTYVKD